jgi:5-methylcytosine-specific restriction endonuclease McrBC regulatory subunit McrC
VVGDVKYKRYEIKNDGVDISDYHQLLTYSLVYDSDTFIVYLSEDSSKSGKVKVETEGDDERLVHLIGFDPGSIDEDESFVKE